MRFLCWGSHPADTLKVVEHKRLVIFDGDDTLWRVEELYDSAIREAERSVEAAGLSGEEWRRLQREYDLRNVKSLGMSPDRFPLSSRQALLEVARKHGEELPRNLVEDVVEISRAVFVKRAPVIPGTKRVLSALKPSFELVLLTKGDSTVQRRRVRESGLSSWFARVQIVSDKDEAVFKQIISDFDVQPDEAWSVGNSLASDVNPAIRAGLNAVWIDAHVWEHERRELEAAHTRVVVLERLEELPEILLPSSVKEP
jgi:putative hydrolase of the HAD superfamily